MEYFVGPNSGSKFVCHCQGYPNSERNGGWNFNRDTSGSIKTQSVFS